MSGSGGVSVVDKGGVGGGVVALDEGLALLGWQAERLTAITQAANMRGSRRRVPSPPVPPSPTSGRGG